MARVLAKIAFSEFPDSWPTFLQDSVFSGSREILRFFLEIIRTSRHISSRRRNQIHSLLLREENISLLSPFIIDPFSPTPTSFYVLNELLQWAPIPLFMDELSISFLTEIGLTFPEMTTGACECLTTLLVERLDADEFVSAHSLRFLSALFSASHSDRAIAVLLTRFLTVHFDRIGPPGESLVLILSDVLRVLSAPGWATDADDYFAFWSEILSKPLTGIVEPLFDQLLTAVFGHIPAAIDEDVISLTARACVAALCRVNCTRVVAFLRAEGARPSRNLSLFLTAALSSIETDPLLEMFFALLDRCGGDPVCMADLLPCIARFFLTTADPRLLSFLTATITTFWDSGDDSQIQSAIVALNCLTDSDCSVFFLNGNDLLNLTVQRAASIAADAFADRWALTLFSVVAAVALKTEDADLRSSVISESLARVRRVLSDPLRHLQALPDALGLLLGFCCRCFFVAQVLQADVYSLVPTLLRDEQFEPLSETAYELAAVILSSFNNWDDADPLFHEILDTADRQPGG
jgi:hypothetical protein